MTYIYYHTPLTTKKKDNFNMLIIYCCCFKMHSRIHSGEKNVFRMVFLLKMIHKLQNMQQSKTLLLLQMIVLHCYLIEAIQSTDERREIWMQTQICRSLSPSKFCFTSALILQLRLATETQQISLTQVAFFGVAAAWLPQIPFLKHLTSKPKVQVHSWGLGGSLN